MRRTVMRLDAPAGAGELMPKPDLVLVAGYRTRDPEAARAATLRYLAHAERFAQNVAGAVR
ncbi:MAG: hypothetical protein J2P20_09100 [Pseudonocardia sp.]|nr:hypothetical protein [Pseudonocardia sp.]